MMDSILTWLPLYIGIGVCFTVVIIFFSSSVEGTIGIEFLVPIITLYWLPLLLIALLLHVRDLCFEYIRVHRQDKGGDDQ